MPQEYVAIDVETTGLDRFEDAVIEVGVVVFDEESTLDEWSSLVDPSREVPPFIKRLTGITQEMVQGAPTLLSLRGQLRRLIGDRVLVGHNISFDMGFLEQAHVGVGQLRMDTVTLASILVPEARRHGLADLARTLRLGEEAPAPAHRALADARRTAELFRVLMDRAVAIDALLLAEIVAAGRSLNWPETHFFKVALDSAGQTAFGRGRRLQRLFRPPKLEGHVLNAREELQDVDVDIVEDMLRPGGNFGKVFPGYEYRPQQVEMASAVAQAFNDGKHLMVEAGTGTGKSIGYLLPAAFWSHQNERCIVVSTNTINLQDQLVGKDLPQLQALLSFPVHATVLKGKRNYLCTRLFKQMRHSGPGNADEMVLYARLLLWLPGTETGDVSEISVRTPGEQMAWNRLSADNDTCQLDKCREERCPLHMARRRAEQAHILVVNHSLLLADVAAGNRVLPPYRDLIIDEAHHLESAITDALSFRADRRFFDTLLEEIVRPRVGLLADLQGRVREAMPGEISRTLDVRVDRLRNEASMAINRLDELFDTLDYFLQDHVQVASPYPQQVRLLAAVRQQASWEHVETAWENVNLHLKTMGEALGALSGGLDELTHSYDLQDGEDLQVALESLRRTLEETRQQVQAIIADPSPEKITWIELYRKRVSIHAAPLHVGSLVEQHIFAAKETVVLTSATLRTAGRGGYSDVDFAYLRERLCAQHADEHALGSPFDYENNTLVYLVSDMPEPNQPGYQRYVEEAIVDVALALKGRTMALFTSYGQLRKTAQALAQPLAEAGVGLLVQGEGASRRLLLEEFQDSESRTVLLGTRSFWEGVDVPGAALQAVIIARLPFDVPTDPIFAARSETFENPFFEYSIPEAVLRFRQGFGRLIRRRDDEGIVVVLDKRVLTRRYGQSFLDALPECTVIRQRHHRLGELTMRWFSREREV